MNAQNLIYLEDRKRAMDLAEKFHCTRCGHSFNSPIPACPTTTQEEAFRFYEVKKALGVSQHRELEQALADLVCPVTGSGVDSTIIGFGLTIQGLESLHSDLSPLRFENSIQPFIIYTSYEAYAVDKVILFYFSNNL